MCRRYPTTRFLKLRHVEAEMEASVVPAVLAYKAGELFAIIIRIVDEILPDATSAPTAWSWSSAGMGSDIAGRGCRPSANTFFSRANVLHLE
jgi:hypothetical protein